MTLGFTCFLRSWVTFTGVFYSEDLFRWKLVEENTVFVWPNFGLVSSTILGGDSPGELILNGDIYSIYLTKS